MSGPYQTVDIDLTAEEGETPDARLNALAAEGWRVLTVLEATATTFKALMEQPLRSPTPRQPARAPTGLRS